MKYQLVLVRHGESVWNKEPSKFTGWTDVKLTEKGELEGKKAGKMIDQSKMKFDIVYTSVLKRAIKTMFNVLEESDMMWLPVNRTWRLNERHYGNLQGLKKKEAVEKWGPKQVHIWRRSYDVPPPALEKGVDDERYPGKDEKYSNLKKEELPLNESLKMTIDRVLPFWKNVAVPKFKEGKKILIVAHGNSIRAMVKYLENMPDDKITSHNIPTGIPIYYELDENFKPVNLETKNKFLLKAKDIEEIKYSNVEYAYIWDSKDEIINKIGAVANQTKVAKKK